MLRDRATRKPAKDCWNSMYQWHDLHMSSKVIKSGTNRKLVYDFLLALCSNFRTVYEKFDMKQISSRSSAVNISLESSRVIS